MLYKKFLLPPDGMPVRLLDECFLLQHTSNEWVTHFCSMPSEYDATENEVKLVLI